MRASRSISDVAVHSADVRALRRYEMGKMYKVTAERLRELARAIASGPETMRREFTMSVPVQPERDADLVLSAAADAIDALEGATATDRQAVEYLLHVLDNVGQFKLPIPPGLDPTHYATNSYEGDLAIAQRIEEIRRRIG